MPDQPDSTDFTGDVPLYKFTVKGKRGQDSLQAGDDRAEKHLSYVKGRIDALKIKRDKAIDDDDHESYDKHSAEIKRMSDDLLDATRSYRADSAPSISTPEQNTHLGMRNMGKSDLQQSARQFVK